VWLFYFFSGFVAILCASWSSAADQLPQVTQTQDSLRPIPAPKPKAKPAPVSAKKDSAPPTVTVSAPTTAPKSKDTPALDPSVTVVEKKGLQKKNSLPSNETLVDEDFSNVLDNPQTDFCGTAVTFLASPKIAAAQARQQQKLLFLLHVSGNFEDPGFT